MHSYCDPALDVNYFQMQRGYARNLKKPEISPRRDEEHEGFG
jgi:hypothetical protein